MPGMAAMRRRSSLATRRFVVAVVADGAHVDLRRQAEIEDLGHDVGGLEIEHASGKAAGSTSRSLRT